MNIHKTKSSFSEKENKIDKNSSQSEQGKYKLPILKIKERISVVTP